MSRPSFDDALVYWRNLVHERGLSPQLRWVFREHLCLGPTQSGTGQFHISFQTQWPPVAEQHVRSAYEGMVMRGDVIVFEALVHTDQYILCALLGDTYLVDGDVHVQDWDLSFYLKEPYRMYEEITDETEWKRRKKRENKHLSGLDFVYLMQPRKWWQRLWRG